MKAVFVELPAFERHRADYLDDDVFRDLQNILMLHPEAGDLIPGTGGLRKLRFVDVTTRQGETWRAASNLLLVGYRIAVLAVHSLRQGRDRRLDAVTT